MFSWCDFIAGWTAGVCGLVIGHPLDTIKVRQQTFRNSRALPIAVHTFKHQGVTGFYRGMGFPLLAAGALNSIFFGMYGICLQGLGDGNVFLAGVMGGIATISIGCPVDLVKVRLQSHTSAKQQTGPITTVVQILREHGVRGLYRGAHTMVYRDSFSSGIYFWSYAEMLARMRNEHNALQNTAAVLVAGGIAGTLSWASIMPLDVVKSRIQADSLSQPKYSGIWDCVLKSYRKDGLSVFGRGFTMCCVRSFPVNAATFLGYEICLKNCRLLNA